MFLGYLETSQSAAEHNNSLTDKVKGAIASISWKKDASVDSGGVARPNESSMKVDSGDSKSTELAKQMLSIEKNPLYVLLDKMEQYERETRLGNLNVRSAEDQRATILLRLQDSAKEKESKREESIRRRLTTNFRGEGASMLAMPGMKPSFKRRGSSLAPSQQSSQYEAQ